MPAFAFRASNADGRIIEGERNSPSSYRLQQELTREGLFPIEIEAKSGGDGTQAVEDVLSDWLPVPRKSLANLYDEIATLLEAGLPILEALKIVLPQTKPRKLATALADILSDVEEGIPVNVAMARHPELFDETSIRMIEAGEFSGSLDRAMRRVVEMIEFDLEIQGRIKAATRYPKLVLSTLLIGLLVILLVVMPKFITLFNSAGAELPLITQALLAVQHLMTGGWPILLALALVLYATYAFLRSHKSGDRLLQTLIHRIPLVGSLRLKIEMSRVFHILGMMLECGVEILASIQLAARITDHITLSEAMHRFHKRLEAGDSISDAISEDPFFPPLVQRMIIIGDKTGRLGDTITKLSHVYEKQSQSSIKRFSEGIEPFLIAIIAFFVLIFAMAIFLPMWDLVKVVNQ